MIFTVEVPDNAKNVKVSVLCDGEPYCCKNMRYRPAHWNGINGGTHYGQYFDMEDVERVKEMMEIAALLSDYGIKYTLTKLKRQYRITISQRDYHQMDDALRRKIIEINYQHINL